MEGAKIHAENSIRQKNQALNYRRMSARIDAVAARVQTAVTMRQVTSSMGSVVKSMESAMKSMNLEKVWMDLSRTILCGLANLINVLLTIQEVWRTVSHTT